jgi:hypothetical protein
MILRQTHSRTFLIIFFFVGYLSVALASGDKEWSGKITLKPANEDSLESYTSRNQDGDGEGEELPSTSTYYEKGEPWTSGSPQMSVTNLSLCSRPSERKICESFLHVVDSKAPKVGTDVSTSRIASSGFATLFLVQLAESTYPGADKMTAFLGVDTQSGIGPIVLRIYATVKNNLIQISAPTGLECTGSQKPGETEGAFLVRACVLDDHVLNRAHSEFLRVTKMFALAR